MLNKILFITHEASRTGAPLVLLSFLRWLRHQNKEIHISILVMEPGVLSDEFRKVSNQYIELDDFRQKQIGVKGAVIRKLKEKTGIASKDPARDLIQSLAGKKFDVVYANTVKAIPFAIKLKVLSKKIKLIVHIHELDTVTKILLPSFQEFLPCIEVFIAVSRKVESNLINYGVDPEKIELIYEFIDEGISIQGQECKAFTVGGMGTVEWRKGADIFLQIVQKVKKQYPQLVIQFKWAGFISEMEKIKMGLDIRLMGLQEESIFIGKVDKPDEVMKNFSILLLTSREDPFPLVAIEAGMMGKPIICFAGATGTEEILTNGGGEIVPYLDIDKAVEKILSYYNDREKLDKDGEIAALLFSEFSTSNQAPKVFKVIDSIIKNI